MTEAQELAPLFASWLERGRSLLSARERADWNLADWLAEGREQFGNQAAFDFLGDELGIAPKRLKAAVKTVELFPPHLRDGTLTFHHHEAVSSLPSSEAMAILKIASEQHLDERETRVAAVQRRAEISPSLLPDEDWAQAEMLALQRAWNRARPEVRVEFLDMANDAGGGVIDA